MPLSVIKKKKGSDNFNKVKIILFELTGPKLLKFSEYRLEEWTVKTKNNCIKRLIKKIEQIS